jgi:hypothetical protein
MKTGYFPLAVAFTLLLIFGYGVTSTPTTGTDAPAPADDAPFKGRVLGVMTDSHSSFPLENVQVRKMGDRSFLVGKGVDLGNPANWTKGRNLWLPMSHVVCIVEFGSVEEMKKAKKTYEENMPDPVPAASPLPVETPEPPPAKQP